MLDRVQIFGLRSIWRKECVFSKVMSHIAGLFFFLGVEVWLACCSFVGCSKLGDRNIVDWRVMSGA